MKRICSLLLAAAVVLALGASCFADALYCRNCGQSIPEDSRFCLYCGTEVVTATDNSANAPSHPKAEDKAAGLTVAEIDHYITVSNGEYDIWVCDTDTNLIKGHPSLEYYGPSYLHNDEIGLYLFQWCPLASDADGNAGDSVHDSAEVLMNWFADNLGGENRAFSNIGAEGGYILVLHSDNMLTPDRYPFYGTVFCSRVFEDVELFWSGPFDSSADGFEEMAETSAALYPVEITDGEFYCLSVFGPEEEWLEQRESSFNPDNYAESFAKPAGSITVNSQNWSDYFDIVEDLEDNSLLLEGAEMFSCKLYTKLRLKDRYASRIDVSRNNAVEFTVQYKECMGHFTIDFDESGIISVTDPDGFSTVKKTESAVYSYRFPEENSVSEIPVQSVLSGDPTNGAIGIVNRYVEVLSASGTLYFKSRS